MIPGSRISEVHPDDIVRLNAEFYGEYPHNHFNVRLMLALAADEADCDLTKTLLKSRDLVNDVSLSLDELEPEDLREVAKFEILTLSHHVSETLLRLFYVHAEHAACPWLRLAELKGLGVTNEIADQVLGGTLKLQSGHRRLSDVIPEVCFGVGIPGYDAGLEDPPTTYSVATAWLEFAANVAKSSPLSSAYRHGLTVSHREGVFLPGSGTTGTLDRDGNSVFVPSYAYLRKATKAEAPATWVLDHARLDERQRAGSVMALVQIIDNVLAYGAARRLVPSNVKVVWQLGPLLLPELFKQTPEKPRLAVLPAPTPVGPGFRNGRLSEADVPPRCE